MSLNIKSPAAHDLAREVAEITGESLTTAVTEALRERLERLRGEDAAPLSDRLLAIGRDCASRLPEPYRSADHGELLYGDDGLPA
ncbi:MAG TPA: type II toxin-antitoxin system VapB family antitoxin [Candidatus Nanopelagicales bacterium]|nr:type II toxin-antitoxin system VapB family antitoxin [Candidatus Nanopelagicales bacterium]